MALVFSALPALAMTYQFYYGTSTSSVQAPSVGLVGGTSGTSTISSVAPDAAIATEAPLLVPYYLPITLTNSKSSSTGTGFQQEITFNPSLYKGYESSTLSNIRFCADAACATPLYAWLESCTPSCTSSATAANVWVKLTSSIGARGGTVTIYMGFLPAFTVFDGTYWGEAPALSSTYGQYDNGANVFVNYYRGDSTSGWTVHSTAGTTASAPAGSASGFGAHALYANSANGDYMDINAGYSTTSNYVIQYYTYSTGLGNLYFSASSTGLGTMGRIETRSGSTSGFAKTASWTSWHAPSTSVTLTKNKWYQWSTVINASGTTIGDYYATSFTLGTIGTQINALGATYQDSAGAQTYTASGAYIGLVGDALGATYITYWNGIIIRVDPPSGVMPSVSMGSVNQNYILAISNPTSSSWSVNLGVASDSNINRLSNLTIWLYSPVTSEIQLGTGVTQKASGPVVALAAFGTLYIEMYAVSTSGGTTTVTLTAMVQAASSTPYADYTISLQVN